MTFQDVLNSYRKIAFSEKDKGYRFERLIQAYFKTDPTYANRFKNVWLWEDFLSKKDFGTGADVGIDLVAQTHDNEYWAIQCKCYDANAYIDKAAVDSFLTTSARSFLDENMQTTQFAHRIFVSTTNKWSKHATDALHNQTPSVTRLNLAELEQAPVDWEKLSSHIWGEIARNPKKSLFQHQQEAVNCANDYFKTANRGKLIMACGTGKTFTSLRIAENETNGKGLILFLVPSIALLGQTLREWTSDALEPINAVCICSDPEVSRHKNKAEDTEDESVIDLALPASTNITTIASQFRKINANPQPGMTVVFSTYQSIEVIAEVQKKMLRQSDSFGVFDLIICDEAHRTTGVTLSGSDESAFTKVHNNEFIKAHKRLYMTATPRLYDDNAKSKAAQEEAVLCSMDDPTLYGNEIYRIGFGRAVDKGLLTDYKVLILTINENDIPPAFQNAITNKQTEINTDDVSKLIGCINAISKQILGDEGIIKASDPDPMKRAVAFCQSIKQSKKDTNTFNEASNSYITQLPPHKQETMQTIAAKHIDGTMGATDRNELLAWLKQEPAEKECRILTNVRCLSEGVDVPSLDAVLFLSARNSQVDVVQSVGRVMRKAPDKKYGYIIIPVFVPANIEPDKALDENERYKVVWTVLNALRAHDDRFDATIHKIELNKKEQTKNTNNQANNTNNQGANTDYTGTIIIGKPPYSIGEDGNIFDVNETQALYNPQNVAIQLKVQFEQLQSVFFARMVQKVGDKRYWEQWAKSVGEVAQRQTARLTKLINDNPIHHQAFNNFLTGLHKNINPSITQTEAIEMLSQHIITKPVFDALFEGYSFVKNNPVSQAMQQMLNLIEEQAFEKDAETLEKFYESVKMRASGINTAEGKQRIIIELYDKFFKTAFPKMVERLGIVYTPIEVVDFIIQSVNDILIKEFNRSISDENIHILDPFTGTGTFITRLLQSKLIQPQDLERKYKQELHANEIVLLAYYIAAINIENAYHDATPDPHDGIGTENYTPFDGIVLTDTFQLGETDNAEKLFSDMFPKNSQRVQRQKKAPLRVIMGNPPYSIGQKSANDNAQNLKYNKLDKRISNTYVAETEASNTNSLYDSYIRAYRWSTDRLDKTGGIICFVSNGAWLDGNAASGFRKCIEKEFTSIYVLNLRGNQRTSGELSRKEGGKIFGSGSRTPIAITLLVKNPEVKIEKATIYYHDIGDYLTREDKLKIIKGFKTFANPAMSLNLLLSNEHGDWLSIRNDKFGSFIPIGDKADKNNSTFFKIIYSRGIGTSRDHWAYNFSKERLIANNKVSIEYYNKTLLCYLEDNGKGNEISIEKYLESNPSKISWTSDLKKQFEKGNVLKSDYLIRTAVYRPFNKINIFFDRNFIYEFSAVCSKMFPEPNLENRVILISGLGGNKENTTLISRALVDLNCLDAGTQCFPLYYYEENNTIQKGLFDTEQTKQYTRRDAISNFILERAQKQYGKNVTKEDIFYYVYGFLHSKEYRETFANDLKKMLPRLPLVEEVRHFWAFSKAGRQLADLHLNYESIAPHPDVIVLYTPLSIANALSEAEKQEMEYLNYRVQKMRFPKKDQKDTIIYNSQITIENIPAKAYEYVVNGKSAIEWVMERYQVSTHKESGITNNPNDWSAEVGNPRYILDLLLSIINVSTQTVAIVEGLPKLNF